MPGDSHFVGAISPLDFLQRFMSMGDRLPSVPTADFSELESSLTVRDAGEVFIRIVEKSNLCPSLRFFLTKPKKRMGRAVSYDADEHVEGTSHAILPLAARRRPRPRRGHKKKRNLQEYHDFTSSLLGIDIRKNWRQDPFVDPDDYECRQAPPSPDSPHAPQTPRGSPSPLRAFTATPALLHTVHEYASNPPAAIVATPERAAAPSGTASPNSPNQASEGASPKNTPQGKLSPSRDSSIVYGPFEREGPEAEAVRADLLAHAKAHFARQHRRFLFQVILISTDARFILWDRSGAIVSERFTFVDFPHILADFLWRFAHMDDARRGWDTSASCATRREAALFTDVVREFLNPSRGPSGDRLPQAARTLEDKSYPVWKLHVINEETGKSTDLLTKRPFAGHSSLFGRSTRAYLAYDLAERRLVFLKDSWRVQDKRLQSEFHVYKELQAHKVPFIPEVIYGGDVPDAEGSLQETRVHLLSVEQSDWRYTDNRLEGYVHHRIVQDIAYPIDSVRDERELMQALNDTLVAIDTAYQTTGILHRDLSAKNVMLDCDGRCVLNDWDHAGPTDPAVGGIGTPLFQSILLLLDLTKANELVDDLESLFWVLNFVAVTRFALHMRGLPLELFVDQGEEERAQLGSTKLLNIDAPILYEGRYSSHALMELIRGLGSAWGEYHLATNGDNGLFIDGPAEPEHKEILELAEQPSFWREKFAAALRNYEAELAGTKVSTGSGQALETENAPLCLQGALASEMVPHHDEPAVCAGTKRKAVEGVASAVADAEQQPRRSKRLKAIRERR